MFSAIQSIHKSYPVWKILNYDEKKRSCFLDRVISLLEKEDEDEFYESLEERIEEMSVSKLENPSFDNQAVQNELDGKANYLIYNVTTKHDLLFLKQHFHSLVIYVHLRDKVIGDIYEKPDFTMADEVLKYDDRRNIVNGKHKMSLCKFINV